MKRKKFLLFARFWGMTMVSTLAAGLLIVAISWSNHEGTVRANFWYTLAVDGLLAGCFSLQIIPFSIYTSVTPLMLATGCRRKELIRDFQLLKVGNLLGILALMGICLLLQFQMKGNPKDTSQVGLFFGAGFWILLLSGSTGNLMGTFYQFLGKWAVALYMIICGLGGGFLGMATEISSGSEVESFGLLLENRKFLLVLLLVALAVLAADLICSRVIWKRAEVRC